MTQLRMGTSGDVQYSGEWSVWCVKLKQSNEHNESSATELHVLARTIDEAVDFALLMESDDVLGDGNMFVYSVHIVTGFWFSAAFLEGMSKDDT